MRVSVNIPGRVFEYFKDYPLDELVDCLLEQYDFTALPATTVDKKDRVERVVNVTDPVYIQLYNTVGPRSKKVSLARLLEFAYNMDVLSNPHFRVKPTKNTHDPTYGLVNAAYKKLLQAQQYHPQNAQLKDTTDLVYLLREVFDGTKVQ